MTIWTSIFVGKPVSLVLCGEMFPAMYSSRTNGCGSSTNVLASFITGASHLMVPGRMTALRHIPQGTLSGVIDPANLVGHLDVQQVLVLIIITFFKYL